MALADIEPVEKESTAGIIARRLREAIMSGSLPPGVQLGESDLAARFEVSRGPLREAMQRLVQEGLLRSEPHRGLFVIELEPGDVYDIYAARVAVEQAAALRILRGDHTAAADQLQRIHGEMAAAADAGDDEALGDADLRFHEVLVRISGSRRLVRMSRTLIVETRMCLSALRRTYESSSDRLTEHAQIIEALRQGNRELVVSLLESHMEDAVQRLAPGTSLHAATVPNVPQDGVNVH